MFLLRLTLSLPKPLREILCTPSLVIAVSFAGAVVISTSALQSRNQWMPSLNALTHIKETEPMGSIRSEPQSSRQKHSHRMSQSSVLT